MTLAPFGLRHFARFYCSQVAHHLKFLGLDNYQIVLSIVLLAFLCGIAFMASGNSRTVVDRFCPPWLYCLLLICALFVVRLPTFLPRSLNPDEAMFLAGAMKLRHYPVFWRSLDGATSGPLNYYPLTLLNLLGLPFDFATARLLNVVCIGGAIAIVYRIARLLMADWAARLTPLPPLAAAMAFRGVDFLHYSSECVSVLLIASGTWLLFAESLSNRANWLRSTGIGVVAALIPLAKLQAAPMAVAIAGAGLAHCLFWRRENKWRGVSYILAGSAAVIACLGLLLTAFGELGTFRQSYIVMNLRQANMYPPASFEAFWKFCLSSDLEWYEAGIVACLAAGAINAIVQRRAIVRESCFLDLFVVLLLASSVYAVYRPRTGYAHYLQFLVFPLALVGVRTLAWSLRSTENQRHGSNSAAVRAAILFVLLALALPSFFRSKELKSTFESETWMLTRRYAPLNCVACRLVSHFAKAGDPVAIWGWAPELYVLTDTLPATREPQTPYQMTLGGPQLPYYRRRYLEDLQLHPPKAFVDAVGPSQFRYTDRATDGFETFPELREYVSNNFYLAGDIDGVRVFARKDAGVRVNSSSN